MKNVTFFFRKDPSVEEPDATNEDDIQHLLDSAAKDQHELNELTMKNQVRHMMNSTVKG